MATFSQFKSKYIIERRSKNVGDEGTKNIVKKLLEKTIKNGDKDSYFPVLKKHFS